MPSPLLPTVILLLYLVDKGAACAPGIGNLTGQASAQSGAAAAATEGAQPASVTTNMFATVTVDTTVPWSDNADDQQAASLPIETQGTLPPPSHNSATYDRLRSLNSIYVHDGPKIQSIAASPSGNGTRIVSEIGWNGSEGQLRDALTEAFKFNELMASFDVEMKTKK